MQDLELKLPAEAKVRVLNMFARAAGPPFLQKKPIAEDEKNEIEPSCNETCLDIKGSLPIPRNSGRF